MRGPQANLSAKTQLHNGDFWRYTVKYFQKGEKIMGGVAVTKTSVGNGHNAH